MLEFIVLGQIPGTQLQITLAWFAFALLGGLIWADLKLRSPQVNPKAKAKKAPVRRSRKTTSRARA